MDDSNFDTNILRLLASELYFLLGMTASREMFGKSYFALGAHEKTAVDQAVLPAVGTNYQALTPDLLKERMAAQAVGFQAPEKTSS